MSAQLELLSPENLARALRDDGIKRSADHAGDDWKERAYGLFLAFCAQHPSHTFMTEDARHWSADSLEQPPDNRAWGYVAVRAAKAGVIVKYGYAPQRDPKHHKAPGTVWRIVR